MAIEFIDLHGRVVFFPSLLCFESLQLAMPEHSNLLIRERTFDSIIIVSQPPIIIILRSGPVRFEIQRDFGINKPRVGSCVVSEMRNLKSKEVVLVGRSK